MYKTVASASLALALLGAGSVAHSARATDTYEDVTVTITAPDLAPPDTDFMVDETAKRL